MPTTIALLVMLTLPSGAGARASLRLWPMAEEIRLTRQQDSVALTLRLLPRQLQIPSQQALVVEPWLLSSDGRDSICMPTIGLYGRAVYYNVVRGGFNPFQNDDDLMVRARELPDTIPYAQQLPMQPWMKDGVEVCLHYYLVNGCSEVVSEYAQCLDVRQEESEQQLLARRSAGAQAPQTAAGQMTTGPEQKVQKKRGTAYIDFLVNSVRIDSLLHDNQRELGKIRSSLDSLVTDTSAVITRFSVCGYASPDGPYLTNLTLASGRSETLSQFISKQYGVPRDLISSTFVAEDWAGVRRYVEKQDWMAKQEILDVMDKEEDPDRRLSLIQRRFPTEYADMRQNLLPFLRRSEYTIEYEQLAPNEQRLSPYRHRGSTATATAASATRTGTVGTSNGNSLTEAPFTPLSLPSSFKTYRPLFALKTNLLFDAALCPNVEIEIPMGRWSLMVEDWFPWFRVGHNKKGEESPYYRSDQRPTRHSYELWTVGAELRYWFAPRCRAAKPTLSGTFIGIYGAGGKYDLEWKSEGYQGEFTSFGLTIGHSWVLSRHWNLELSASGGYVGGPYRHYTAEFDDARLIYRDKDNLRYIGPTKLKLSLSWLLGRKAKKGGEK